jgi:hypothetical protein
MPAGDPRPIRRTLLADFRIEIGAGLGSRTRTPLPRHIQSVLQDAVDVRDRLATGPISAHGGAIARGHLLSRLLDLVAAAGTVR